MKNSVEKLSQTFFQQSRFDMRRIFLFVKRTKISASDTFCSTASTLSLCKMTIIGIESVDARAKDFSGTFRKANLQN